MISLRESYVAKLGVQIQGSQVRVPAWDSSLRALDLRSDPLRLRYWVTPCESEFSMHRRTAKSQISLHLSFAASQYNQYSLIPSRKHAYIILTPLNPLLYSKTEVYRGIHYFSYFAQKHRGGSNEYPKSMFWVEIWTILEFFIWKFSLFGGEIFNIFE